LCVKQKKSRYRASSRVLLTREAEKIEVSRK
jgi:hypothetical protein